VVVIGHNHLQQIVEFAGEEVAFEHFRHLPDLVGKPLHRGGAVVGQRHMDEAEEIEAHRFAIDQGDITPDDPLLFELAHALLEPRTGQLQSTGQLGRREPRVLLQMREQPPVQGVQLGPRAPVGGSRLSHSKPPADRVVTIRNLFKSFC
jgi:hypothetical protein